MKERFKRLFYRLFLWLAGRCEPPYQAYWARRALSAEERVAGMQVHLWRAAAVVKSQALECERLRDRVEGLEELEMARASAKSFQHECFEWVRATFPDEDVDGVIRHFKEEVLELLEHPEDDEEMADVFLLLQCLASHYGVDLMAAARAKFEKCRRRKWEKVEGRGYRHVKEGE